MIGADIDWPTIVKLVGVVLIIGFIVAYLPKDPSL